jgi:hypothetical protein
MLQKRRVLAAKIETTVGTDITPAAADGTVQAYNAEMNADIDMFTRERQGGFSPIPAVTGMRGGTCKFSIDLTVGNTAPVWASTFLPACGLTNLTATTVWQPDTNVPGAAASTGRVASPKTLTISLYRDGAMEKLIGAAGNAVFNFMAGRPVKVDFTFRGVYVVESAATILAPTYVTDVPPRWASAAFTVNAVAQKAATMTLDLGNEIILRESQDTAQGYHSALITDRTIKLTVDPEAVLPATYDPRADWLAGTERVLSTVLTGVSALTFGAPKLQVMKVTDGNRNKNMIENIEYQLNGSSSLGDDELTLTFS